MSNKKYIYHYFMKYDESIGTTYGMDGIVELDHPITTEAEYLAFKFGVLKAGGFPVRNTERAVIHSLTLLGAELDQVAVTRLRVELRNVELRNAVADYVQSEGCSCCEGDNHGEHAARLAEMLDVPPYEDGSGYDFHQFRTGANNNEENNHG